MLQKMWQRQVAGQDFWDPGCYPLTVSASLADWLPTAHLVGPTAVEIWGPVFGRIRFLTLRALLWRYLKPKHCCRWAGYHTYSTQLGWDGDLFWGLEQTCHESHTEKAARLIPFLGANFCIGWGEISQWKRFSSTFFFGHLPHSHPCH